MTQAEFELVFRTWAQQNADSPTCTVVVSEGLVTGTAWLAILHRVPTPGAPERRSGDVQSVYVEPAHRGGGLARSAPTPWRLSAAEAAMPLRLGRAAVMG